MTQTDPSIAQGVGELVASIAKKFPAFAPLLQIPELAGVLIKASEPGNQMSPQDLQLAIQATDWWKTNSDSQKAWQITKLTNPASAAQTQAQAAQQILAQAGQSGIVLTPLQVATLAQDANEHQWDPAQLQQNIGAQANRAHLTAGTIQNTANQLQQTARNYGVPLSPQSSFDWAQKINEGTATTDGFNAYAIDQAKLAYPTLSKHLDQGMTTRQLADPYFQIAGQTLGVDPNALDLSDPRWSVALQSRDAQGNIVGPMNQLDWQRKLMTDTAYGYAKTAQGQQAGHELADNIATTFGKSTLGSSLG